MSPTDAQNPVQNQGIIPKVIEEEMKTAYLNYAMSVIVGRALPDVKDGLKPVHRRILYAMHDMGLTFNKPFKKCARIVGQVLGAYHPHGDASVYDALVRMTQDFSLRYPLIKGQGNFGSIDGDSAAAYRYCVTGDTLILTNEGMIPINEISLKKEAKINLQILNYQGNKKKAIKFFNSGKHEIFSITTVQGYTLKGSFNHPILCWENKPFGMPSLRWKWLSDITTGDYVLLNRGFSLFSKTNPSLVSYFPKLNRKEKKITLPKVMNKSLAFLLGALVSEGSFHQKKILFNNKDLVFYNKVKASIFENFPEVTLYERDIKGNCKELELYHQKVVRFLENLGLKQARSGKKEIPHIVLKSKEEVVRSFLSALFEGDGSVQLVIDKRHGGKSIQLLYDSKSKKLIQQLKVLLLNFGVITTLPALDKRSDCLRIYIPGANNIEIFRKKVGFYSKRKQDILAKVKDLNKDRMSKIDNIPFLNTYLRRNYSQQFIQRNNFDRYNRLKKNQPELNQILRSSDKSLISWLLKHKYLFNEVKEVKKLKEKETVYSVKVDSSCHSFVANGFVNHNTEAKLHKLAQEMLKDIEKDTVPFRDNFDASMQEPVVLPTVIPGLLVNGSSGIAVGMATNIPPHNLSEVCEAVIAVINNPDITLPELMEIVPAPDFPTGGEVCCGNALKYAYAHGKGKVVIKSIVETEERRLIVKEIPYQVNKEELIKHIAHLVRNKLIEGIRNINDESDREGIRVVIDLKKDADPQIVLNQLFKHSRLKVSFGMNMLALVDNQPKVLGLRDFLQYHIDHRKDVIVRRTKYDLNQAQQRVHLLQGLLVALDNIDEVIPGIKQRRTVEEAKQWLMDQYSLSEVQAKAILEMRLQKLASLEQDKIRDEHRDLLEKISYYESILASDEKIFAIIKAEARDLQEKYGDKRRSRIVTGEDEDLDIEDLITEENVVVTMTNSGYVKRLPLDTYRTQRRGGKGVKATGMKEEDFVERLYVTSTHDYLLIFTDEGQVYWIKVYRLPDSSRQAKGQHIANLLQMNPGEKINAIIPVRNFNEGYLFMATSKGVVKKTSLQDFSKPRRGGIRAITLDDGDRLVGVKYTTGDKEMLLATKQGQANRFREKDVRFMGRTARGVRGIRLARGDTVIGLLAADETKQILTLTELGYGKRTEVKEYRLCNRGGKGVTNIKITEKNGNVKAVMLVDGSEELMLVSRQGIGIRIPCSSVSIIGRATQGVRVMRLNEGDVLAAAARIVIEDKEVLEDSDNQQDDKEDTDPANTDTTYPADTEGTDGTIRTNNLDDAASDVHSAPIDISIEKADDKVVGDSSDLDTDSSFDSDVT